MSKKILKKVSLVIFIALICFILIFINNNFYQPPILGKLKLRYISSNNYHLIYKNKKFAARVTAVDSWYIEEPFVYGSTSIFPSETDNDIIYFFIDVCDGQKYQTKNRLAFNRFLNNKNISKKNRYYMSGDNALDIKQPEYSSKIECSKYS